jgi:hypothetical protein
VTVAGCTDSPQGAGSRSAETSASAVRVTGLPDGQIAEVTIADGAESPAPDPSTGLTALSEVYSVGPSGQLAAPAHVTIPLTEPATSDTAVFAATREDAAHDWEYLPATLSADGTTASFDVSHFSLLGLIGYNVGQLFESFKKDFLDGLAGDALANDTDKPICNREVDARADGYHITSSNGDTVFWCFGIDDTGRRVLQVHNHRRYPLQVLHPNMQTLANPHDYLALSSLSRLASGGYAIIKPGATAVFNADLGPGGSEGIRTEMDGFGQSLYALQTGVETLFSILTRFGAKDLEGAMKAMDTLVSLRSCADSLDKGGGAYFASCFTPDQMITAFGAKAVLLVPLVILGPLLSFVRSEWNALVDTWTQHDKYVVAITRDKAQVTLANFTGPWSGHTRQLEISADGRGHEHIDNGCCDPMIDLTFNLSGPQGPDPQHATATATVTAVQVGNWDTSYLGPAPQVGDTGTFTIDGHVITDSLTQTEYCDDVAGAAGTCGA